MNTTSSTSTMSATAATSTTHDFHVCLDHLSSLRRALADLETTLGAALGDRPGLTLSC